MSYFAVTFARGSDGWSAQQVELDGAADVDEVADVLRDADEDAQTALLLVEEDDEYVAIVRVDAGADEPRVFLSDGRAADSYPIAAALADALDAAGPAGAAAVSVEAAVAAGLAGNDPPPGRDAEPVGDAALLADLGTSPRDLLALCAHEGTLPSDVVSEVCERAGWLAELEAVRGT